ncbi:hypothetical protein BH09DEP1_BH09DEP1_8010 [soil metagenome]
MMKSKSPGTIILLNGTSSSGKSTVAKELQTLAPHAMFLKIDDYYDAEVLQTALNLGWKENSGIDPWLFLNQYLTRKTGNYYFDTEVRQQLFTATDFFYSKAKLAETHGKTIFIDTVLEYASAYQEAFDYFKASNFFMILIYCPMQILLAHVQERNSSGIAGEHRSAFLAFEHFKTMYKLKEHSDEPLVDMVNSGQLKESLQIAIQELVDQGNEDEYLPKLEKFKEDFIAQFKLDQTTQIEITTQYRYLAVFKNDTIASPDLIAQKIKTLLAI